MNSQAYYRVRAQQCNFCDKSTDFLVNCAGFSRQLVYTKNVRHDYYLMYVVDGEMSFCINDNKSTIKAGEFMIISPETIYFFCTDKKEKVSYFWVHFTGSKIGEFIRKCKLELNITYNIGIHKSPLDLWQRLFNELILLDELFTDVSESLLKEMLIFLSRYVHSKSISQILSKSIMYIHENYMNSIQIETLAELENICLTSYREKFQEAFGCSAKEYLINVRLNHASRLLIETDFRLKKIASLVGYNDVYYFSRIFKKKTGTSPQQFRCGYK